MFLLHLRFSETCYTKSCDSIKFLLYFRNEVSIVFPSYLSQDVSAVVRFCYVFATDFNILVKFLPWKQTDHGFVHGFYYLDEIETLGDCTYLSIKL